ncbi:hypothetical protein NDU88_004404 [Pleurodeles waltl]|uniref:Uncharacterized protein n=1 Tax=Pleurodeles waltl TaxID=8319 RepID=A0AAV7LLM2_PLEWA|nr:hypothetical protein NDU88_004404 [Pleurodeles waltl]
MGCEVTALALYTVAVGGRRPRRNAALVNIEPYGSQEPVRTTAEVTAIFYLFNHSIPDLRQERTYTATAAVTSVWKRQWLECLGKGPPAFTSEELEKLVDGVLPQYTLLYGPPDKQKLASARRESGKTPATKAAPRGTGGSVESAATPSKVGKGHKKLSKSGKSSTAEMTAIIPAAQEATSPAAQEATASTSPAAQEATASTSPAAQEATATSPGAQEGHRHTPWCPGGQHQPQLPRRPPPAPAQLPRRPPPAPAQLPRRPPPAPAQLPRRPPPPALPPRRPPPAPAPLGQRRPPAQAQLGHEGLPAKAPLGQRGPPAQAPLVHEGAPAQAPLGQRGPPAPAPLGQRGLPAQAPLGHEGPPAQAPLGHEGPPAAESLQRRPPLQAPLNRAPPSQAPLNRAPPSHAPLNRAPPSQATQAHERQGH